jgi:hypothetical protein
MLNSRYGRGYLILIISSKRADQMRFEVVASNITSINRLFDSAASPRTARSAFVPNHFQPDHCPLLDAMAGRARASRWPRSLTALFEIPIQPSA